MPSKKPTAATVSNNKLVVVESPTKAKTIGRFLGKEHYIVEACLGHVRDLPKSKIGIDVARDFQPTYITPSKAKETIAKLKQLARTAAAVILATDEDREGEAISWHLIQALDLGDAAKISAHKADSRIERIAFHEITPEAITAALAHPRPLDLNLVDAQQARRVLDRLVGYELSPFLWRKVRYGLSAGRVQSVAVRLVVERERQIQAFQKQEYWSVEGLFQLPDAGATFPAHLYAIAGASLGKMAITTAAAAKEIVAGLTGATYHIADVTAKEVRRTPAPPFTTSTLQQEAARKLGFSAKQTMVLAQKLYENGHITYMRTDSVHLAPAALSAIQEIIGTEFGMEYRLDTPRQYATKSRGAQEAHEAIRPTNLHAALGGALHLKDRASERLYNLIWKRTIASQIKEALLEQTAVNIAAETSRREIFRATGQTVKFDGFIRVYTEGRDEDTPEEGADRLPRLKANQTVQAQEINPLQHFTEPPPRYTDATLVKTLEAAGVGRPSTYAPTLSTIQDRGYVEKDPSAGGKKYQPTEIGILVNDLLVANFPEIVDIAFTSHIEAELDQVAEGTLKWTEVCREFYGPFKKNLEEKEQSVTKRVEVSATPCPHCKQPMVIKFGRMGKFLACPEPGVKVTLPLPEEAAEIKELTEKTKEEKCPLCGKAMAVKRGRFGYFLGCSNYPTCRGIAKIWNKTGFKCPRCTSTGLSILKSAGLQDPAPRGEIVEKKSRGRGKSFYACTRYPDCTFAVNRKPETAAELAALYAEWQNNPPKPRSRKTYSKKNT